MEIEAGGIWHPDWLLWADFAQRDDQLSGQELYKKESSYYDTDLVKCEYDAREGVPRAVEMLGAFTVWQVNKRLGA